MELNLSDEFRSYQAYGLTLTSNLPLEPWLPFSERPASLIVEGCRVTESLPILNIRPLLITVRTEPSGIPCLSLYRLGEILYLKMPLVGNFFIGQDKIRVQFDPGADLVKVCAMLLSNVLSLWLEQRKIRALHASCLVYQGKAAAFMADSTTGKSTLAAALLRAGAEFLSDDIVPITETPGGFFASPGYPTMRLSQEQAGHFLGEQAGLAHWVPALGKALISIGENGWSSYCNIPQKIQRLYILNRNDNDPGSEVRFEPLSDVDSVLSLIRFSFLTGSTLALGIVAERMAFFARLVEQVRVTRLIYPSGYEHLTDVTQRIFQDMDKGENI